MSTDKQKERENKVELALQASDVNTLKKLYQDAEKDVGALITGLSVIAGSGRNQPRPSDEAIFAIRDIALSVIELAKTVVSQKDKNQGSA